MHLKPRRFDEARERGAVVLGRQAPSPPLSLLVVVEAGAEAGEHIPLCSSELLVPRTPRDIWRRSGRSSQPPGVQVRTVGLCAEFWIAVPKSTQGMSVWYLII